MPTQKAQKGDKKNYTNIDKPWATDDFGTRKLDPSVKRQIDKAHGTLPDSVGVPSVDGSSEQKVFDDAHALIEKLKTSKETTQDF
jgi:hypothetical protein